MLSGIAKNWSLGELDASLEEIFFISISNSKALDRPMKRGRIILEVSEQKSLETARRQIRNCYWLAVWPNSNAT